MTSTTTLKLPEELKARIAALAEAQGKSAHAFMVEALQAQAQLAEQRRDLIRAALAAEQEVAQYGRVYSADEVHRYLRARLAGKKTTPLKPTKRR
jgi:predicted transcriptional regulator